MFSRTYFICLIQKRLLRILQYRKQPGTNMKPKYFIIYFFSGALIFIGFAVASLFIDPNEENHLVPDVEVQYVLIWHFG